MNITIENNYVTIFNQDNTCTQLKTEKLPFGTLLSAQRLQGKTARLEFISDVDGSIFLCNNFATELLAVSDSIKVGRFGDFLQKVYDCRFGEFLEIKLQKGVTYIVTALF